MSSNQGKHIRKPEEGKPEKPKIQELCEEDERSIKEQHQPEPVPTLHNEFTK